MPANSRYRVRITDRAHQDIDDVLTWLVTQAGVEVAAKWWAEILAAIDTLERLPERCGRVAEAVDIDRDVRELFFGKRHGRYRVIFEIHRRRVDILHIRHGTRDMLSPEDLR